MEQDLQEEPDGVSRVHLSDGAVRESCDRLVAAHGKRDEVVFFGDEHERQRVRVVLDDGLVHRLAFILDERAVDNDERLAGVFVVVRVRHLFVVECGAHELFDDAELVAQPGTFIARRLDDVYPAAGNDTVGLDDLAFFCDKVVDQDEPSYHALEHRD